MVASSRDVAAYFKKEHFIVLRDIDAIASRLPEFAEYNFVCGSYTDANNQSRRMIDMTRDGFTFLVMGYNGKKADAFKLAYLNEFNRMEEELRKQARTSIPDFSNPAEAARAWALEYEQKLALEAQTAALTEEVDTISQTLAKNAVTVPRFMSTLDHRINQMQVSQTLCRIG